MDVKPSWYNIELELNHIHPRLDGTMFLGGDGILETIIYMSLYIDTYRDYEYNLGEE